MAEGTNSFGAGMNQDASYLKRDPGSYFSMRNFKILTSEGSSTGSMTTEDGTLLSFKVPDTTEIVLKDGTIIPAQSGLKIIGSAVMNEELIIFTTAETSAIPNGYGQIWKCKYDEGNNRIIDLDSNDQLVQSIHLFYNQKLNFSTEYRIGRAIALYETESKQRVYWTDNYNNLRTFNLAVDEPLETPLSVVDVFSGISLSQPVFKSIGSGTLPVSSQVQFTYRLIDANGAETAYAPPTPLIPLPDVDVNSSSFIAWDVDSASGGKSITYNLYGLDTSYTAIQHVAIVYSSTGVTIYNFKEDTVPVSGELEVICSGVGSALIITPEQYSIIESGFTKCKDIEVKDGRLVAANLGVSDSSLDFDSRAYRFNNNSGKYQPVAPNFPLSIVPVAPIALLRDSASNNQDLILLGGSNTTDWDSIPKEHDAINIYNKEQEAAWFNPDQQYKYKRDGSTIGGSGKNISYEFITSQSFGNNLFSTATTSNHISLPKYPANAGPKTKGVILPDGSTQKIEVANQTDSNASIWAHSEYVNHARGEVYRYGIVFYDKKGVVVFTNWIGDIKFPDVSDGYPLQTYSGGNALMNTLGIKFTVDVSSVADKVSGYSIVRLKREEKDKTRLGTGFFMYFERATDTHLSSLMHKYWYTGINNSSGTATNNKPFPVTSVSRVGANDVRHLHLPDRPGFNTLTDTEPEYKRLGFMISPLGNIQNLYKTDKDYIETLEYYSAQLYNYWSYDPAQAKSDYAFHYKMGPRVAGSSIERYQVGEIKTMYSGEYVDKSNGFLDNIRIAGIPNTYGLANTSYSRGEGDFVQADNEKVPLGIGNPKLALKLKISMTSTFAATYNSDLPHMASTFSWAGVDGYYGPHLGTDLNFSGDNRCDVDPIFKAVGYRRYLDEQYNGDSYESRSNDQYVYIGHFQAVNDNIPNSITFETYGGDTYVNYHDNEYMQRYNNDAMNLDALYKPHGRNELGIAVCGPVESPINTNYTAGLNWAQDRDGADMDFHTLIQESYNPLWNQEDTVNNKFFSESFLSSFNTEFPATVWASAKKINGELSDSWRNFPIANKRDVEGLYGPINRITNFKDKLIFHQDKAFGVVALNERSVIQDQTGQSLVLGEGGVFPYYDYISTNTGSVHQFAVIASENSLYHYDARLNKVYQFSGNGLVPISDVKGMSSFFKNKVKGLITQTDKTTRSSGRIGVHGVYDIKNNRVLFTFLGGRSNNPSVNPHETLSFNELTGAFESFYDYFPSLYLEYGRRVFSVSTINQNELHTHTGGAPGVYYGSIISKSLIHTIFSNPGQVNKIFNNIAYNAEMYDSGGNDVYDKTFDTVRYKNNYQDAGTSLLIPNNNVKRRMRTWRHTIGRDLSTPLSRMRNHWLECILEYENKDLLKHTVHDITYSFTPTRL